MSGTSFGEKLKSLRLGARVGLRELARLVDKSPGYLSDVENGRVPPPSDGVILDIASALRVDKQELLSAASKMDPELSDYVAQQPKAADFLRHARERTYDDDDWERLARLAEIAKLGKEEKEKK
jgi:transcriptional regulator with XRE-family HTH domain